MIGQDYFAERDKLIKDAILQIENLCRYLDPLLSFKLNITFNKGGNVQLGHVHYRKDSVLISLELDKKTGKVRNIEDKIRKWHKRLDDFEGLTREEREKAAMTPIINKWFDWPEMEKWTKEFGIRHYIDTSTGKVVHLDAASAMALTDPNVDPIVCFYYVPPCQTSWYRRDPREAKHDKMIRAHRHVETFSNDILTLLNRNLRIYGEDYSDYISKGVNQYMIRRIRCFYVPSREKTYAEKLDGSWVEFNFEELPEFNKKFIQAVRRNYISKG